MGSLDEFRGFLQRLQNRFKIRDNDQPTRELIVQACESNLSRKYPNIGTKDSFLGQIAIAAISIANNGLFRDAVDSLSSGFDKTTFFDLGKLICFQSPVVLANE